MGAEGTGTGGSTSHQKQNVFQCAKGERGHPQGIQPRILPAFASPILLLLLLRNSPSRQDGLPELKRQAHHAATCLGLHLHEEPKNGEKSLLEATGLTPCLPPRHAELPWTRAENEATGIKGRLQRHTVVLSIIQVHLVLN